jgi:ATP synthase I chain
MGDVVDSGSGRPSGDSGALERRLFQEMKWTVLVAVLACAPFAPWRVTVGVLLGGVLSILNHHWLRNSIAAIFADTNQTGKPRINMAGYVLRYVFVGAIVFTAHILNLVSLPATMAGLCSIVVAFMIEAGREFYFAIFYRED